MHFINHKGSYIYESDPCLDYEVRGTSEYKLGDSYTENRFSSLVYYTENPDKLIGFKNSHFFQTGKGLVYQLAQDFSLITSDLLLQLNTNGQVIRICNLPEIYMKYEEHKPVLLKKHQRIPDFDILIKNFETNIKQEEKLRKSLFYYGIQRIILQELKNSFKESMLINKQHEFGNLIIISYPLICLLSKQLLLNIPMKSIE